MLSFDFFLRSKFSRLFLVHKRFQVFFSTKRAPEIWSFNFVVCQWKRRFSDLPLQIIYRMAFFDIRCFHKSYIHWEFFLLPHFFPNSDSLWAFGFSLPGSCDTICHVFLSTTFILNTHITHVKVCTKLGKKKMISSYLLMMDFETIWNSKIMYSVREFRLVSCLLEGFSR